MCMYTRCWAMCSCACGHWSWQEEQQSECCPWLSFAWLLFTAGNRATVLDSNWLRLSHFLTSRNSNDKALWYFHTPSEALCPLPLKTSLFFFLALKYKFKILGGVGSKGRKLLFVYSISNWPPKYLRWTFLCPVTRRTNKQAKHNV